MYAFSEDGVCSYVKPMCWAVSWAQNQQLAESLRKDPIGDALNTMLSRWLTVWKPFLVMHAPVAYDMVCMSGTPESLQLLT